MSTNFFRSLILLFCLMFGTAYQSKAVHAALFEISYRHITGNTYEFTLVSYRNCFGPIPPLPTVVTLRARSASLGVDNVAGTLTKVTASGNQPPNLLNCYTTPACYEEHVYRGTVNLNAVNPINPLARDWVFSSEACCYPAGYSNISSVSSIYSECGLNNLDFPAGNDSPYWHERFPAIAGIDTTINYPLRTLCEKRHRIIDQAVVEPEGDLVKYEFIHPLDAGGGNAVYLSPYSFASPMAYQTPPGLEIDSMTGIFELIADAPGIYVLAIKATEYRASASSTIKIGHTIRHLTLMVEPAATCPDLDLEIETKNLELACNDSSLLVEVNNTFVCASADSNASFLELVNVATIAPVTLKSVEVPDCWNNSTGEQLKVNLHAPLMPGNYYLTTTAGSDGNTVLSECGTELPAGQDTVWITVDSTGLPEVWGSPDGAGGRHPYMIAYCGQTGLEVSFSGKILCSSVSPSGSDFLIIDSNSMPPVVNPLISSAAPGICTNGETDLVVLTLAAPLEGGRYGLQLKQGTDGNSLLNKCGEELAVSSDAVGIRVPEVEVDLGPDLTYCKDSLFQALLEAPPGYAYQWSTGSSGRQIIVVGQGTYFVTIENAYGCQASDTVVVREIDCSTGIAGLEDGGPEIYPNPSAGELFISNHGPDREAEVVVSDIHGKEVHRTNLLLRESEVHSLDLTMLPKGIYFVRLSEKGVLIKTERVVLK